MNLEGPFERLIAAKVRALLHDPPYKSVCICESLAGRACDHEKEARTFRRALVEGTVLEGLGVERYDAVAKSADVVAAGFDRWILSLSIREWTVAVDSIANIFNPRYFERLPSIALEEARERSLKVAQRLRDLIIRATSNYDPAKERGEAVKLAYTLLYALYEPLYYLEGLPPSLADTRVPTHTVFDHLYATASMVNLTWYPRPGVPLRGFLVIVDLPGIHEFVDAARKAGDYWAGSWLISNTVWRLAEKLFDEFGPDVLLSPTNRMNPYFYFRYLDRLLKRAPGNGEAISRVREEVRGILENFLGRILGDNVSAEAWLRQPLIPGTVLFVLPKGIGWTDTSENVSRKIRELYSKAWRELVVEVLEGLKAPYLGSGTRALLDRVVYKLLEKLDIVKRPPIGVRVKVVDVEDVYCKLLACFKGDRTACRELGLNEEAAAVSELAGISTEERLEELAKILAFHVATTTYMGKVSRYVLTPVPGPFWRLDTEFVPGLKLARSEGGWTPCSQCGLEPAVLVLRKGEPEKGLTLGRGVKIWFNEEDLRELLSETGLAEEVDVAELRKALLPHFKPGEALGPYCLLKRAVYLYVLSPAGLILSTEDVAMGFYTRAIQELLGGDAAERIARAMAPKVTRLVAEKQGASVDRERILDACRLAVGCILGKRPKDLELALYCLREAGADMGPDYFASVFAESVAECLMEQWKDRKEVKRRVFKEFLLRANPRVPGYEEFLREAVNVSTAGERDVKEMLKPRTRYAIVHADGDDVGGLHFGNLGLRCRDYVEAVYTVIKQCGGPLDEETVRRVREALGRTCAVLRAMHGREDVVAVSPTLKSALSTALMLTALKDVVTVEQDLRGVTIYAGGDDTFALIPIDTVPSSLLLRKNYEGENFFHRLSGTPLASAIPLGRSMSVRVVGIPDLMSEEVSKTFDVMEEGAKKAEWERAGCAWKKDTLALSSSRVGAVALLPLRVGSAPHSAEPIHAGVMSLLATISASLALRIVSGNLPEDFEALYGRALGVLVGRPDALRRLTEHVVERNVRLVSSGTDKLSWGRKVLGAGATTPAGPLYGLLFDVVRKDGGQIPLLVEVLKAFRIVRWLL